MKRTFDLNDFIDALTEAREVMKLADAWESKLAGYEARATALQDEIARLAHERDQVGESLATAKQTAEAEMLARQADLARVYQDRQAALERDVQRVQQEVQTARKAHAAALAQFAQEQAAAKEATSKAQAEFAALTEALARSRQEAAQIAKLLPVGSA